jgi:adenylate cyclase
MRMRSKHAVRLLIMGGSATAALLIGIGCLRYSFAQPIARLSYDLPFIFRSTLDTHEVTLVYLDEPSAKQLGQPLDEKWDRQLYARLLDRLTQEKARLVFFDILFDSPSAEPAPDVAFAEAIQRSKVVVLGGSIGFAEQMGLVAEKRVLPPLRIFRHASAGWGLLSLTPLDPDYSLRHLLAEVDNVPTAAWKAAQILGATSLPKSPNSPRRWINYYGPRTSFSSVGIAEVLNPDGIPPGYFANKVVLIGSRFTAGYISAGRDEFATPYSRWSRQFSPGLEIHATMLLNWLHGDWLTRMPETWETLLVICFGLIAGTLTVLRPLIAVLLTVCIALTVAWCEFELVWMHRVWFDWLVPSGIQLPFGLVLSLSSQYLLEARRRKALRKAFGFYLSPEMADKIANSDFDLQPGGKVVEATIIFTDLENFTTISEDLDPAEVSRILIAYFEQTTQCILRNKGTILKYVGDAVMAGWGAPINEPAHAARAAEAACDLRELTELEVRGKKLRTRVGVNTGNVLAGNLGSSFRFDYTMIGDTTNFASRLESLNKYLGTQVLIADSVRQQLGDKFVTRRLGDFCVAGKTRSVTIHELLRRKGGQKQERSWIEVFEHGLNRFQAGDLTSARSAMIQTCELRGGKDGPSAFYLRKIAAFDGKGCPTAWTGIVELSEK